MNGWRGSSCTEEVTGWISAPDKQRLSNSISSTPVPPPPTREVRSKTSNFKNLSVCFTCHAQLRHTGLYFNSCFNYIWTAGCTRCFNVIQHKKLFPCTCGESPSVPLKSLWARYYPRFHQNVAQILTEFEENRHKKMQTHKFPSVTVLQILGVGSSR